MAGIEVAGLALGAIPVILEAIKGYRETYEHIQNFKHATKQLQIVDAQFRVCRLNFLSECRLLLYLVVADPQLSQEMVVNTKHQMWHDASIAEQMVTLLHENIDACATIISDTTETISALDSRLAKLQIPPKSASSTIQRARVSATFMMEKSRFDRDIATLRKRNADLNLLRMQFSVHEKRPWSTKSTTTEAQNKVKRLTTVRLAASMLHETLKTAWSCSDTTHLRHWVKLCVDCDSKENTEPVTLDMAFSSEVAEQQRDTTLPTIWLYVRSESVQSNSHVSQRGDQDTMNKLVHTLKQTSVTQPPKSGTANSGSPLPLPTPSSHTASKSVDLCKVACVCSHFRSKMASSGTYQKGHCFGYLQSPCRSRYLYFGPSEPGSMCLSPASSSTDKVTALKDVIEQPQATRLQLLHQYQLALRIARSVLQFHNTAWLPSVWRSKDLAIVGSKISDQSLGTLHLSTRFETQATTAKAQGSIASTAAAATTTTTTTPSAVDTCCKKLGPGVYNDTLFCLGIVLLEIAHWQTFEQMREGDPDEFYAAHRIVRGPPPLGTKYRKIVERCLRCDFGASEDLEDIELQRAVWSKVVYPLEALVRDISQEA